MGGTDDLHRAAASFQPLGLPLQPDQLVAVEIAGSPHRMGLVGAGRRRQPVLRAEKVYGARFAVVAGKDPGPQAFFLRERPVDLGHLRHQLRPTKLIAPKLWQRADVRNLGFRGRESELLLIGLEVCWREQRQRNRGENGA